MKSLILLLLSISYSVFTVAQIPFVPGSIVLTNGDTIKGEIRDLQWLESPDKIEFRSISGEVSTKTTDDIKAFSVTGKRDYMAFTFKFDGDMLGERFSYPNQFTPGFPRSRLPVKWIERTRFLQVILQGSYSLYKFTDEERREHFFLQTPNNQFIEELQYHEYVAYGTTLNTSQYFRYQLQSITKECTSLQNRILSLKYNQAALMDILQRINECKGGIIIDKLKPVTGRRKYYLGPIINLFSLKLQVQMNPLISLTLGLV